MSSRQRESRPPPPFDPEEVAGADGAEGATLTGLLDAAASGAGVSEWLGQAVSTAAEMAGASYAAVAVLDAGPEPRVGLVVHTGEEPGSVEFAEAAPDDAALLALLHSAPTRSHNIVVGGDSSHGFPGSPRARTLLGVPIQAGGARIGVLCLADKAGGASFSLDDEEAARGVAAAAALRLEQDRQCAHQRRRADWLAASLRITSDLVASDSRDDALGEVSDLAREVSGADAAWIRAAGASGDLALVAVSRRGADTRVPYAAHDQLTRRVEAAGEPERACPIADDDLAVVVPLRSPSGLNGSLTLTWAAERRAAFDAVPTDLPASFAEQAVLALEVARSREVRGRLQVLEERDRIARDLHDVVLQDLFATAFELQRVARQAPDGATRRSLELAAGELQVTSRNIRRSIFGLGGREPGGAIRAEVSRLVQRATAMLKLDVDLTIEGPLDSLDDGVARDVVAVLSEALSNVVQHARAEAVEVRIEVGERVCLSVVDDGVGIPADVRLSGLANIRERADRHAGHLTIERATDQGGTTVVWIAELPAPVMTGPQRRDARDIVS